jgi:hypothetical protein
MPTPTMSRGEHRVFQLEIRIDGYFKTRIVHINNLQQKCRLFSVKSGGSVQLSSDGAQAETRVRLSAKRTSPCDSEGATFQSTNF